MGLGTRHTMNRSLMRVTSRAVHCRRRAAGGEEGRHFPSGRGRPGRPFAGPRDFVKCRRFFPPAASHSINFSRNACQNVCVTSSRAFLSQVHSEAVSSAEYGIYNAAKNEKHNSQFAASLRIPIGSVGWIPARINGVTFQYVTERARGGFGIHRIRHSGRVPRRLDPALFPVFAEF
ncbi:hypothetical protein EVAR_23690_1 [Eumeta japonica]|uniref:Uncharacterized protein n=1 Tax=Eumeta variegata TaxID=151549 RepID=A0A4C1VIK7_EUMVA|nr:hypothetical protein EVAR_23690_1 [Eumeta japonica]